MLAVWRILGNEDSKMDKTAFTTNPVIFSIINRLTSSKNIITELNINILKIDNWRNVKTKCKQSIASNINSE